jgi:hypothetical protein
MALTINSMIDLRLLRWNNVSGETKYELENMVLPFTGQWSSSSFANAIDDAEDGTPSELSCLPDDVHVVPSGTNLPPRGVVATRGHS